MWTTPSSNWCTLWVWQLYVSEHHRQFKSDWWWSHYTRMVRRLPTVSSDIFPWNGNQWQTALATTYTGIHWSTCIQWSIVVRRPYRQIKHRATIRYPLGCDASESNSKAVKLSEQLQGSASQSSQQYEVEEQHCFDGVPNPSWPRGWRRSLIY